MVGGDIHLLPRVCRHIEQLYRGGHVRPEPRMVGPDEFPPVGPDGPLGRVQPVVEHDIGPPCPIPAGIGVGHHGGQRPPLPAGRRLNIETRGDGGADVGVCHERITGRPAWATERCRWLDDERYPLGSVVCRPVVTVRPVFAELLPVVRRDDNECLRVEPLSLESLDEPANMLVGVPDLGIIPGQELLYIPAGRDVHIRRSPDGVPRLMVVDLVGRRVWRQRRDVPELLNL